MPYYTAVVLRALVTALTDANEYPDALLDEYIAEFEEIAEDYRGVAFISREATETFTADRSGGRIVLANPRVTAVGSFTVGGVAVSATNYRLLGGGGPGVLVAEAGFSTDQAVAVTYTHGYTATPKTILRACREYVRACALSDRSGVPRDVIWETMPGGGTLRYSTPDVSAGRPTGWLEVDRLLNMAPNYRGVGIG